MNYCCLYNSKDHLECFSYSSKEDKLESAEQILSKKKSTIIGMRGKKHKNYKVTFLKGLV